MWRDMQERLVDAIRKVDDQTLITCCGLDYTFDLSFVIRFIPKCQRFCPPTSALAF